MDTSIQTLDDLEQKKIKAGITGERPMETVGVYLKRERESKNISLREVARLTKISERYLDCIEKDDYEKIPQGPYVKGYISTYSRMIGGDTDQALKLYDALNKKREPSDETPTEIPQTMGWKASIAAAFTSLADSVGQIIKRRPDDPSRTFDSGVQTQPPPSLFEQRKTSLETARPEKTEDRSAGEAADKTEKSVLIPFKRYRDPKKADDTAKKTATPPKSARIQVAAAIGAIGSFRQKLIHLYGQVNSFLRSLASRVASQKWPVRPRTLLIACAVILVGGAVVVFSAFGVYHLFFFDAQPSVSAGPPVAAGSDSAARPTAPPDDSELTVPHKTSRLKKPVVVPQAPASVETPSASTSVPPDEASAPPQPAADQKKQLPREDEAAPVEPDTAVAAAQPVEADVSVLKATICSAVRDRMPSDTATTFPLSVDRVYVWNQIHTKQYPTVIRHIYYHEGRMLNQVDLSVRSPFWRTWSFKSIDKDRYRGKWHVDITTKDGQLLRRLYFEID